MDESIVRKNDGRQNQSRSEPSTNCHPEQEASKMIRPAYLLQNIHAITTFLLLITYSAADEQVDRCSGDEQTYCDANGVQSDGESGHLIRGLHDEQQRYTSGNCLRAGVVEYNRVDVYGECMQRTEKNLNNFEEIAKIANENGVKMLVFPEDGINYASAKAIVPCLEEIPDPEALGEAESVPCDSKLSLYDNAPILTRLSCIAKKYNLYLVANYGTREPCDNKGLSNHEDTTEVGNMVPCPVEGRDYLLLNTNVVLNPRGQFIKRYRKWHPFTESEIFDKAPKLEHVYFDTPYGRFGLFTCFDMIYRDPAVDLVEDYHIDTAIFPTWWFDEAPILRAVQYQDGWSATNRVNLLASNILKPSRGSTGSSIFSGNNSLYVTDSSGDGAKRPTRTKLLIANLAIRPREHVDETCDGRFNPKVIEIDNDETIDGYRYRNFPMLDGDPLETLDRIQDNKTVCSGEFCCTFDYQLAEHTSLEQMKRLVLIVRDGRRAGLFQWYEQVCAVAVTREPLPETNRLSKKDIYDSENGANFLRLSIGAKFQSRYVYPATAHDGRNLVDRKQRRLACHETTHETSTLYDCQLELIPLRDGAGDKLIGSKIYTFAMYGRMYERDPDKND